VTSAQGSGVLAIELGRNEPSQRLARLAGAWPRTIGALMRAGTSVDYVDLRYRAGFAARIPGFREKPKKAA
jgi:cell division septal protein FtsQ